MCGFSLVSVAGRSCHSSLKLGLEWDFAGGVALSMGQSVPGLLQALMYGGSALRLETAMGPVITPQDGRERGIQGIRFQ